MARPPRIEFPGAIYIVGSHRAYGAAAFADDADRAALLAVLAQAMQRFDAQVLAYCLVNDGFELLLFTRRANLSRLMRHVNGVYTQQHRRRHGDRTAFFHGRFKALLVDREALLLDACRHVELATVRSGQFATPRAIERWPWSSYPAHARQVAAPTWLDVEGLHAHLLSRPARTPADHRRAAARYAQMLAKTAAPDLLGAHQREQLFIGDAAFAARMRALVAAPPKKSRVGATSSRSHGSSANKAWSDWLRGSASREQALYRAHVEGGLTMKALAASLGLSVSRISRLITGHEQGLQ